MQALVKWFNNTNGRGDGPDVFVDYTGIGEGYKIPNEGTTVEFQIGPGPKGSQAANVIRRTLNAS